MRHSDDILVRIVRICIMFLVGLSVGCFVGGSHISAFYWMLASILGMQMYKEIK